LHCNEDVTIESALRVDRHATHEQSGKSAGACADVLALLGAHL